MRILFTIPHVYRQRGAKFQSTSMASRPEPVHGSDSAGAEVRARALTMCLTSLHQTFGIHQAHIMNITTACNDLITAEIEVVICTTTGADNLVDRLPGHMFRHHPTNAEPLLLGYECHAVLADNIGKFDYFCFLEDDIHIADPLFFWKQIWFTRSFGSQAVLQPHRFELSQRLPIQKLYVDGPIRDATISPRFQNKYVRPRVRGQILGTDVEFERVDNPHAGCFFLTSTQMEQWIGQSYFLDRATDFWGPLESAATLGLMRTFEVYKPALANAGFLEVRHLDNRYLGGLVHLPPNLALRSPTKRHGIAPQL
jgi:hypothetical protein